MLLLVLLKLLLKLLLELLLELVVVLVLVEVLLLLLLLDTRHGNTAVVVVLLIILLSTTRVRHLRSIHCRAAAAAAFNTLRRSTRTGGEISFMELVRVLGTIAGRFVDGIQVNPRFFHAPFQRRVGRHAGGSTRPPK